MLAYRLWSWRNRADFILRRAFGPLTLSHPTSALPEDLQLAAEVEQFLTGFDWPRAESSSQLTVLDIGCRNFFLAPTLDRLFLERGWKPSLHGIEVDAYRRLKSLRTRKDYGDYFARLATEGRFHAMDFLDWTRSFDVGLVLNPFVLERSILAWGLPLSLLQPKALFQHCARLLNPRGLLLVSAPTVQELSESQCLAQSAGLTKIQTKIWYPDASTLQNRPRLGALFQKD